MSHIREVESIVHVVRCFEDENITHVEGRIDPVDDIEIINLELVLADLEVVSKRVERTQKLAKNDKSLEKELELLTKIKAVLEEGQSETETFGLS